MCGEKASWNIQISEGPEVPACKGHTVALLERLTRPPGLDAREVRVQPISPEAAVTCSFSEIPAQKTKEEKMDWQKLTEGMIIIGKRCASDDRVYLADHLISMGNRVEPSKFSGQELITLESLGWQWDRVATCWQWKEASSAGRRRP